MQLLDCLLTSLSVISIYIVWRRYTEVCLRRERAIQERVTYMLWKMAAQIQ